MTLLVVKAEPKLYNATSKASHWALSAEVREWREAFHWEAKAKRTKPYSGPVAITVHHYRKGSRPVDCGAVMVSAKGAIDGLVDAKVLPGDGPAIVQRLTFLAPEVVGWDGLGIEIEEVTE